MFLFTSICFTSIYLLLPKLTSNNQAGKKHFFIKLTKINRVDNIFKWKNNENFIQVSRKLLTILKIFNLHINSQVTMNGTFKNLLEYSEPSGTF